MSARVDRDRKQPRHRINLRLSLQAGRELEALSTQYRMRYCDVMEALLMGDIQQPHRGRSTLTSGLGLEEIRYLAERANDTHRGTT